MDLHCTRQCVLVRSHTPTTIQLSRWARWAQYRPLYLSLDTTGWCTTSLARFRAQWSRVFQGIHEYNQQDILDAFPKLQIILELLRKIAPLTRTNSLAWGLHVECVVLWYQATQPPHANVWVLEEDVGIVGGVHALLSCYHQDQTSDLITHISSIRKVNAAWMWHSVSSEGFKRNVSKKIYGYEHVQRFSVRFIQYLQTCSEKGWSAWSEMATPSMCVHGGFNLSDLPQCHLRLYNPFTKLSTAEWAQVLKREPNGTICHALKF